LGADGHGPASGYPGHGVLVRTDGPRFAPVHVAHWPKAKG